MKFLVEKLPQRVKVGSYTFSIDLVPSGTPSLGEDNYGMTLFDSCRIFLDDGLSFDRLVNTVLHEVSHAVNHTYGISDGAEEETIATQSANGWMQVLLDNPKLELWLHQAWRELRKTR
jgi:hypothetical protein